MDQPAWRQAARLAQIALARMRQRTESELESALEARASSESELQEAEASRAEHVQAMKSKLALIEEGEANRRLFQMDLDKLAEDAAIRRGGTEALEIYLRETREKNEALEERLAQEECKTAKLEARLAEEQEKTQSRNLAEKQEAEALHKLQIQSENLEQVIHPFAESLAQTSASMLTECFEDAATQEDAVRAPGGQ